VGVTADGDGAIRKRCTWWPQVVISSVWHILQRVATGAGLAAHGAGGSIVVKARAFASSGAADAAADTLATAFLVFASWHSVG
jgi:hypothetical protein